VQQEGGGKTVCSSDQIGRTLEELATREADGLVVSLVWSRRDDSLTVQVTDKKSGQSFDLTATRQDALDVFHHPFAYAAFRPALVRRPPARTASHCLAAHQHENVKPSVLSP
jgi:hypothetical protein